MKYFRSYPYWLQVLLFALMVFIFMSLGTALAFMLLPKITPYNYLQIASINEKSPISLINAAIITQGIMSIFIFLIPALLFSYFTHPQPSQYLGLRAPGKKIQWLLVILIMIGAIPVLEMVEGLVGLIDFGAKVKASQAANDQMMGAFLTMPTFPAFVKAFVVMAIIPPLGEEMLFRGVFLRLAKKRSRTMLFPVLFTALIFALAHANIYGSLSIFLAGILLAVIYYLTGSLWCSILAHMVFNGSQVVLTYLASNNHTIKAVSESNSVPYYLVAGGVIVFSTSFYLLLKNKTPLPDNWANDFPPQSLPEFPPNFAP